MVLFEEMANEALHQDLLHSSEDMRYTFYAVYARTQVQGKGFEEAGKRESGLYPA